MITVMCGGCKQLLLYTNSLDKFVHWRDMTRACPMCHKKIESIESEVIA